MTNEEQEGWAAFREAGMLWMINRTLHIFGWSIVVHTDENEVVQVYPKQVKFAGFVRDREELGYIRVRQYMSDNAHELLKRLEE